VGVELFGQVTVGTRAKFIQMSSQASFEKVLKGEAVQEQAWTSNVGFPAKEYYGGSPKVCTRGSPPTGAIDLIIEKAWFLGLLPEVGGCLRHAGTPSRFTSG